MPGAATEQQWAAFVKSCEKLWEVKCEFCDGCGHEHAKCPSRKKVDKMAVDFKCSWIWGAIKGACYYDEYMKNPLVLAQMSYGNKRRRYK